MRIKHLILMLLLALAVPLAALAQVERTATVYNGTDKECHVPLYGNVTRMDDLSYSQFIMDKSVLQAAGLAGKEITKMTLHLANSVPASYEWTTKRRTVVTLAEVDASELDGSFIQDMTNSTNVFADYLDAHGETMEISFGTPFTYSGEKNLLVQFREEYMYYFNYHPFASYRLPMYYGVYKTGASYWRQVRASNNYSTISSLNCHFVPKTSFTYLTEANWANTKAPKNARITASNYSTGNNNNINYYIRMDWDASDNYTGSYQVLCVPRGTTPLDWSTAATTSDTFYLFEGLQKNTAYDLYVRAKSGLFFTSNAAMASASTPFYPANLDEGPLTFDFNSQTMPNGLDFNCSIPRYLSAYGRLGYSNLGTNYVGATVYNDTPPVTITLPELKFTNANNGLMLEFDLQGVGWEVHNFHTAELQVKIYDYGYDEEVFSDTVSASYPSQHFTFRLPDLTTSNYHIYKLSFSYAGGPGFGLDNIVVRKAPNIMPPYNLAASEITPTSAEISWTDDNTNSHTFDLVYRQKGYSNDPNEWQHYVEGVTNPYTLTGLTPYTDYEVKVKTITSSAYEDSEILGFSTQCTPATVPYNESFAGLTTLPTDWRVNVPEYAEVVTEVGNGRLTLHNTATEVTQNIYGYISTYTSYSEFGAYIILPYFNNLGSLQLSFKAGRTQGTMESLSVGVVADPNNYTDYTEIGTATLTDNANGEVYSYNLVNDAVQSGHIVIYFGKYESNLQSIWLDDFYVQQYAAPTGPVVSNVTNTTATLGWNAGAATQWEVRYKATTDSSWGSAIAVTEPACTITGLTASTDYVAQVRAKYGENLYSEWVSFDGFMTYYSAPILVDVSHPYSHGFSTMQSTGTGFTIVGDIGGWQLISKGLFGNDWVLGTAPGRLDGSLNGLNNYSLYISKNGSTYQYIHGETPLIGGGWQGWGTTVYAARVFTLTPGSYQFSYRWKGKGIHESDYFRVALVPANTVLTASNDVPDGMSYNTLPTGWIALDGGTALNPQADNVVGFSSYTTPESFRIDILEECNYMMVFVWHNNSLKLPSEVNPPVAVDAIGISCVSLIYPPTAIAAGEVSDTEAELSWTAPATGLTPTGYEVQYEPLGNNDFVDAPIVATNTTSVTLTGLMPNTNYHVRVRSTYNTGSNTIYSDWTTAVAFTTMLPRPTDLAVVRQTTSMAQVMWTPVEMTLPEGQSIKYSYQLTTNLSDWGNENEGLSSASWSKNLAPGNYHFRVRTAVYEGSLYMGGSDWSDPITFTIAPWTDPVTLFPLTYGFETPTYFDDGITLGGNNLDRLTIYNYYNSQDQLPAHAGGESQRLLGFTSGSNGEAYLVTPPLRPSTSDALVSFWWYHDNTANNTEEGVTIEQSNNGTSWLPCGTKITRYADESGWVKYEQVVPAGGTDPIYVRLHFEGHSSGTWWKRCYLDDLTVRTLKSEQPYISYVGCDDNSATIMLYDYAVENGYHSSQFEVQYREWRDPSETQNEWVTYPVFENEEPYAFERYLTVNGLQPATCYEFRARARVSYNNFDFAWSNYCEPVRQWTDCGTYTITPTYSYTEDFEELFNGTDCWTIGEGWNLQNEGGYNSSSYCAYSNGSTEVLLSPEINFSGCDNVIVRFWAKGASGRGQLKIYSGTNYETVESFNLKMSSNNWQQNTYSLSEYMGGSVKIGFIPTNGYELYIDAIEIVANAYDLVFDEPGLSSKQYRWNETSNWWPHRIPTASDHVLIHDVVYLGTSSGANPVTAQTGTLEFGSQSTLWVHPGSILEAPKANISNSTYRIYVQEGGQLKLSSPTGISYAVMYKKIQGYTSDKDHYYLLAPTRNYSTSSGLPTNMVPTNYNYDLYKFDGTSSDGLEWRNYEDEAFDLDKGKGYLFARATSNNATVDISFQGSVSHLGAQTFTGLNYGLNSDAQPFYNWNLVGNPFPCNAYLVRNGVAVPFYKMNETGDAIVPARAGTVIKPMEGVFVIAETEAESSVTFTTTEPALGDEPEAIMPSIPIHALTEHQNAYVMLAQAIVLSAGWNWWAPMVQITAAQLRSAISGIAIYSKESADEEVAENANLEPGQMYKLQTDEEELVSVTGMRITPSITISTGTNWIGYTGEDDAEIPAALTALGITPESGDKIISQDGGFAIYNGTTWEGTLTQLTQGQGYVYVH